MHILVVDNDRIQRQLVEEILDNKGHSYVSASDGNEALRILAEQAFEFVLLDVLLPDMDCFSLAEQIKQNHTDGSYLPIMFLSSVLDEATLVKCNLVHRSSIILNFS